MNKNLISGFGLKLPEKEQVKAKIKKVKEEIKITKRNTISSKLPLSEKLTIIKEQVNLRLGKFKYNTQVIYTLSELDKYLLKVKENGIISIDTETNNSIDPITCKIMGACLYTPGAKQVYVPINHINYETGERLEPQLTEQDIADFLHQLDDVKIVMHNAKFDIQVFDFTCMNKCNSINCY